MDEPGVAIRTPDQRLRVFVSSTLQELAEEREAARRAIDSLRLTAVMFELGARPHAPRDLYRAYIEQSDIFVGVYWQRYGWVGPGMEISGLEDEYRLAGGKPMLLYIRQPAPGREERLERLIDDIREAGDVSYRYVTSSGELGDLLANDLAVLMTERFHREAVVPTSVPSEGLPVSLTSFVGRERELEDLGRLLTDGPTRVVTLTGMGGIGKTRLALEAGRVAAGHYEDGVTLVRLEEVEDGGMVEEVIARSLGLRPSGALSALDVIVDYLGSKRTLLILDNLEQVISVASSVASIIKACPGVKVLATSREPLRVLGEQEFQVPPLQLPSGETPEELSQSDAVNLFVDRARAASPGFSITPENAGSVAEICRRLDGLPLAMELAASRTKLLPPETLKQRLTSRLDALRSTFRDLPDRQRTLRSTVSWSYELLSDPERRLFAELGVFEDSFSLEAVEYVCGGGDLDVLDVLESLLDKSLLRVASEGSEPRYSMFAVVREFAVELMAGLEDPGLLEDRHAEHYRQLAAASYSGLRGRQQADWLTRLTRDHPNLPKALRHLLDKGRLEEVADMMWSLLLYWWLRARTGEGRRWVKDALEALDGESPLARAQLLGTEGALAFLEGDIGAAIPALTESIDLFRELHDLIGIATTVGVFALIQVFTDDTSVGRRSLAEARDLFHEVGDDWGEVLAMNSLHWIDVGLGEFGDLQMYVETLERAEDLGDDIGIVMALSNLSEACLAHGAVEEARRHLARAVRLSHRLRIHDLLADSLEGSARIASSSGADDRAAVLFGAAQALREKAMIPRWHGLAARYENDIAGVREALAPEAFEAAWRRGEALDMDGAIAEALGVLEPDGAPRADVVAIHVVA